MISTNCYVIEPSSNTAPYQHKFLQSNQRNSSNFLDEVTYHINLQNLYILKGTCTYHEDMPYVPVLIQIGEQLEAQYHGYKYILQVWNKKQELLFERLLKREITVWAICFNYFLYKGESEERNDVDDIFVINLDNGNATHVINDFVNDPSYQYLCYNDNVLYFANNRDIKVVELQNGIPSGEVKRENIQADQVATISTDDEHRIQALYLDKAAFGLGGKGPGAGGRGGRGGRGGAEAAAGERGGRGGGRGGAGAGGKGGQDERYVYVAIETADNQIDINRLFLKEKPQNGKVEYVFKQFKEMQPRNDKFDPIVEFKYSVRLGGKGNEFQFGISKRKSGKADLYCNGNRASSIELDIPVQQIECSFDETYILINNQVRGIDHNLNARISYEESTVKPNYEFDRIFYQRVKNNCKLFNSFVFLDTNIFVAHSNIVSVYNVVSQRWVEHIHFEKKIDKIYRQADDQEKFEIVVLTADNTLRFLNQRAAPENNGEDKAFSLDKELSYKLEGRVQIINYDRDTTSWSLVLTRKQKEFKLQALYQRKLYDITDKVDQIDEKSNVVFLFAPSDKGEFIIQNEKQVSLYEVEMIKEGEKASDQPVITKLYEIAEIESLPAAQKIHSGLRCNDGDIMILIDSENFYRITLKTNEVATFTSQKCIGVYLLDDNYLYTLCHQQQEIKNNYAGFRLYDIHNMVEKDSQFSYMLKSCQVGCQGDIDFSHSNQRILFQQNFKALFVVPVLHRTTISMMGMLPREQYLATKVINDKFIALSKQNVLTTWDILTGKILKVHKLQSTQPNMDLSNYDIFQFNEESIVYKREWYNKILLRSKTAIEDFDENSFLEDYQQEQQVKKQLTFMKSLRLKFYEHKLIEIVSETEVKEHFNFVHPMYDRQLVNHFIYFNENADQMLERTQNSKLVLYQRVPTPESKRVTWKKILRFQAFPFDLLRTTQHMFVLSPDFSQYIDIDRQAKQFMIRDSLTKNIICTIPKWLLDCQSEPFERVIQRFEWIDNDHFRIINQEGIERIVDMKAGFEEVEFNVIQLYDPEECKDNQLFYDPKPLTVNDTIARLQRKYKNYKSAYFLQRNEPNFHMNQVLFSVDYTVDNTKGNFVSDLSFSFLHWNIIEQLECGELDVYEVDEDQIAQVIYNILPNGESFLHLLASNGDVIEQILQHAHNLETGEIKVHMPFLMNYDGLSPMNIFNEKNDFRVMDITLSYLALYGVDHHSRGVQDALPIFIEHQLPSLGDYLQSRLLQTDQVSKIKKSTVKDNGMVVSSFWVREETVHTLLTKSIIEQDLRLEFIDIPNIHTLRDEHKHSNQNIAQKFFESLAETDDIELFNQKVIQRVLQYKWPVVRTYILLKLFLPYVIFLMTYLSYNNNIYPHRNTNKTYEVLNIVFQVIVSLIALYFLRNEVRQLISTGPSYFGSIWNYLDIAPPVIILVFFTMEQLQYFDTTENNNIEASLLATTTLMMWLKFLYFLRIFDATGYLIRIIVEVVYDMRHFMLVLLLTFIAFGDAMQAIAQTNEPGESQFITGYVDAIKYIYIMVLGGFDTSNFGQVATVYVWILFILCTVFNMIIMFNLLIAIISESFAKINEVATQASFQEKAGLVAENSYLVPKDVRDVFGKNNQYLLLATDVNEEMKSTTHTLEEEVQSIIKTVQEKFGEVEEKLGGRMDSLQTMVEELKSQNQLILTHLGIKKE